MYAPAPFAAPVEDSALPSATFSTLLMPRRDVRTCLASILGTLRSWERTEWVKKMSHDEVRDIGVQPGSRGHFSLVLENGRFEITDSRGKWLENLLHRLPPPCLEALCLEGFSMEKAKYDLEKKADSLGIVRDKELALPPALPEHRLRMTLLQEREYDSRLGLNPVYESVKRELFIDIAAPREKMRLIVDMAGGDIVQPCWVGKCSRTEPGLLPTFLDGTSETFLEHAFRMGDCVYFKSNNASGWLSCQGASVFRVRKLKRGYLVETDSSEMVQRLSSAILGLATTDKGLSRVSCRCRNLALFHSSRALNNTRLDFEAVTSYQHAGFPCASLADVRTILQRLERWPWYWMAEEAIDAERMNGRLAEVRLLFSRASDDGPALLGHYTKVSGRKIAGNVALGARGAGTLEFLENVSARRFPQLSQQEQEEAARVLLERMIDSSRDLVMRLRKLGTPEMPRVFRTGGMSIDLVLRWNESRQDFDLVLMEAQELLSVGIKGLSNVSKGMHAYASRRKC